jgi:hypothetical protein
MADNPDPRYALINLTTGELTDLPVGELADLPVFAREHMVGRSPSAPPARPGRIVNNGRIVDSNRIHIRLATVQLHEYRPAPDESTAAATQFFEKANRAAANQDIDR